MVKLIEKYGVLWPQNGLEKSGIGIKTGGVKNGVFHSSKTADPLLERFVNALGAADKAHRRGAKSPLVKAVAGCLLHLAIIGETQIIIGAHIDHIGTALEGDVVFLIRRNNALGLPQPCRLDLGNLCGITLFSA